MKSLSIIIALSSLLCYSQNYEFQNGLWYNGDSFSKRTVWAQNGIISFSKSTQASDSIINLSGKYVIPPLADVHTHNLCSNYQLSKFINGYLNEGTLYVQVLGGLNKGRLAAKPEIEKSPIQVKYANGGITCTLGHPFTIYEPLAMGIHNSSEKRKRAKEISQSRIAENDAYWFFDSIEDVDDKWKALKRTRPDIIKIMLLDVENYQTLFEDKARLGGKGLSAKVARYVVKKAHKDGYKVYGHIETAADFRLGLEIGVDVFAHLPGYAWNGNEEDLYKYELTKQDLKTAQEKKVSITTTAALAKNYTRARDKTGKLIKDENGSYKIDQKRFDKVINHQKDLLDKLKNNGINITIGSDQYGKFLTTEIDYLYENKILQNSDILNIITKLNAQLIFPSRKIGELKQGYEASFLVLDGNPLEDFNYLKSIKQFYVKGKPIN